MSKQKEIENMTAQVIMFLANSTEEEKIGRVVLLSAKVQSKEDMSSMLEIALLAYLAE